MNELVIARYAENIDWVSQVDSSVKISVYNKLLKEKGSITLPNVGRDVHTHLFHILLRYESLSDLTIFVQGNPFDRSLFCVTDPVKVEVKEYVDYGTDVYYEKQDDAVMSDFFESLFEEKYAPFGCYLCCLFKVSRKQVQSRSKDFYRQLVKVCEERRDAPYLIERLWWKIFNVEAQVTYSPAMAGRTVIQRGPEYPGERVVRYKQFKRRVVA